MAQPAHPGAPGAVAVAAGGLERHLLGRRLRRGGFASVAAVDPWGAERALSGARADVVLWAAPRHEPLGRRLMEDLRAGGAPARFLLALGPEAPPSAAAAALRGGWDDVAPPNATADEVVARALACASRAAHAAAADAAAASFRALVEEGRDVLARHRPDGTTLYVSPSVEDALGHGPADLIGRDIAEICHQDDREPLRRALRGEADEPGAPARVVHRARRRDGGVAWLETVVRAVRDPAGRVVEVRTDSREVTERVRLEEERLALGRVTAAIAHGRSLEAVLSLVAGEAARLLGAESAAVVRGRPGEGVVAGGTGALRAGEAVPRVADDDLTTAVPIAVGGRPWGFLMLLAPARGAPSGADAARLRRFADLAAVGIANAESRERLMALASTDPLTGLANHRVLHERLAEEVARARRAEVPVSLILIDIDRFKLVNDTHGHQVGDAVLRELARRLSAGARTGDTVARIGGEEMAWILPHAGLEAALHAAERLRGQMAGTPFGAPGRLTASFGVAALEPGDAPADLLRRADLALYRAKQAGRNRCVGLPGGAVRAAPPG